MLENLLNFILTLIYKNLFLGIFVGVFLEAVFPPIPSEIILPLSGYLISLYNFGIIGLIFGIIIASFASTLASLVYYCLALKIGRKLIERYGKHFFVDKKKIKAADNWFKKYGNKAVFFGRMVPGLRELISLPAGFSRMNIKKYVFYTFFGFLIWSTTLILIGYYFEENWKYLKLEKFSSFFAFLVVLAFLTYLIFKKLVAKYSNLKK